MKTIGWFGTCLLIVFALAACTPPADPVSVTRPVLLTTTAVPTAVVTLEAEATASIPTASATPLPPSGPTPAATSEVVEGWLTYRNDFYAYTFSYPPEAEIVTQGVSGFPTEELPEGMTGTAYLNRLREIYPGDICVSITLSAGSVHFLAPSEAGGKYADICPGMGIGDYDLVEKSETVVINGRSYQANGYRVHERDELATFRSEFFGFLLDDGTSITYAAGPEYSPKFDTDYEAAHADYLATKEQLLQIIDSYRSFAQPEGHLITETPVFVGGEVQLQDWSPDGRYLAYFEYTQEQIDEGPGVPGTAEGSFVIYDTASGEKCTDYILDAYYPYEGPGLGMRHQWLPDSSDLLILTQDGRFWQADAPCGEAVELTAVFPERLHYFHSFSPDQSRLLIAGETSYWLYDWRNQTATQIPKVTPDMFNNLVWSPNGTYLAITLAGNYTGNLDPVGGSRVVEVASGQIIARHDWEPANALDGTFGGPVWLDEETFIVTLSIDQGPFFMTVDGQVESALPLFDVSLEGNIKEISAYVEPDSGHYYLLLKDWGGGEHPRIQPRIYHSDSGSVEILELNAQEDFWLSVDGRLMSYRENGTYWARPVTAVGQPLTHAEEPDCIRPWDPPKGAISIVEGKLFQATEGCRFLTTVVPPDMSGFAYGQVSPNDQWLAVISRTNALYVISLNFLE